MSAKLLKSMAEEDSAVQRHIGCMNGILHLFDRHHFFQGRRMGGQQKRILTEGERGSLDTQGTHEALHISMIKNSKPAIDKQRLSTDSSRSSISSSCNSSSFSSSIEDTKLTHQNSEKPSLSEISKLVTDSILHRHVRGITVRAALKEESRALTYVDSPRPSIPSPKNNNNTKRMSGIDRSSYLLHKESPRYSYDGRESRSTTKIKELPRYSLDSKRQNCGQIDRGVSSYTNQEPGSYRRQSSLVVKLMGLEDVEEGEKISSIHVSDPKSTSKSPRTQCLVSQATVSSVYGEMEKRLAQLEFAKSGKDLRALKYVIESMQSSKKIRKAGSETGIEPCSTPCSPTIKKTSSPKNTRSSKPTTKVSESAVVTVSGLRKLDLGDKKLEGKKRFEEKRRGSEKTKIQHSPRKISATASPRPQNKKSNLLDSPRSKNSAPRQKSRQYADRGSDLGADSRAMIKQNDGRISTSSSREEIEVTSEYRPNKMESVKEGGSIGNRLLCTVEQPSPVSVLDLRIYEDESPSPVRMISTSFEPLNYDEPQWRRNLSSDTTNIGFIDTNPNPQYISEFLIGSDLFKDLDSTTFLALEEKKNSKKLLEKRLVFDVVNEIISPKVESYDRISSDHKHQLLKGLCTELPCKLDEEDEDCFRTLLEKDLNRDSSGWTQCSSDISGVAVDIERMIFRELISEVLSSNASVRAWGSSLGYRRQLF